MVLFILAYYSFDKATNPYIKYILQCQRARKEMFPNERFIFYLTVMI